MSETTPGLKPAQEKALALILAGRTFEAVAAEVGIDSSTLRRWRSAVVFREALRSARERALEAAVAALQHAAQRAVGALLEVLDDPEAGAGARTQAAGLILAHAIRAGEADFDARLAALEDAKDEAHRRN